MKRLMILTLSLSLIGSASVEAQEETTKDSVIDNSVRDGGRPCALCLRGGRSPDCLSFLITEVTVFVPLTGSNMSGKDASFAFGYEFGAMFNVDRHSAVGAPGFAMVDGHDDRAGIKARYRRWLSPRFASDVSAGVVLTNEFADESKWLVGSLGLSWNDRLHVVLDYVHGKAELQHREYAQGMGWRSYTTTRKVRKLYAGVKVGGEVGALLGAAGGIIGGIIVLSFFAGGA